MAPYVVVPVAPYEVVELDPAALKLPDAVRLLDPVRVAPCWVLLDVKPAPVAPYVVAPVAPVAPYEVVDELPYC